MRRGSKRKLGEGDEVVGIRNAIGNKKILVSQALRYSNFTALIMAQSRLKTTTFSAKLSNVESNCLALRYQCSLVLS